MKDFAFRRTVLEQWKERYPGVRVAAFPETGHFVPEVRGAALSRFFQEFLKASSDRAPALHPKQNG